MSYKQTVVEAFTGLNSNLSPDLIKDNEFRNVINMRGELVGKFYTRTGELYAIQNIESGMIVGQPNTYNPADGSIIPGQSNTGPLLMKFGGLVGIGELIIEEFDTLLDTDRFMVYQVALVSPDIGSDPITVSRAATNLQERIVLAPITGQWRNAIVLMSDGFVDNSLYNWSLGNPPMAVYDDQYAANFLQPLVAPDRLLDRADISERHIDHYTQMQQANRKVVIADRVNGDMLLYDRYSTEPGENSCATKSHHYELTANTQSRFNVDDVTLDAQTQHGEWNDAEAGVTHGMALYKYELEKRQMKMSTAPDESGFAEFKPWSEDGDVITPGTNGNDIRAISGNGAINYIARHEDGDAFSWGYGALFKNGLTYSTAENATEFGSILEPLTLFKQKRYDPIDKTTKIVDKADPSTYIVTEEKVADVYIWQENQIQYYPCSGSDIASGNYLRDIDRFWQLKNAGARITKLNKKTGRGQLVPLGVWRYRYMWDMGDGEYSSPSTELLCPDMLWSAVTDSDFISGQYKRNDDINATNIDDTYIPQPDWAELQTPHYVNNSPRIPVTSPSTVSSILPDFIAQINIAGIAPLEITLTNVASKIYALKRALFNVGYLYGAEPQEYIGVNNSTTNTVISFDPGNMKDKFLIAGRMAARVIANPASSSPCRGVFSDSMLLTEYYDKTKKYFGWKADKDTTSRLVIPWFYVDDQSLYSIFDGNGVIRLTNYTFPVLFTKDICYMWDTQRPFLKNIWVDGFFNDIFLGFPADYKVGAADEHITADGGEEYEVTYRWKEGGESTLTPPKFPIPSPVFGEKSDSNLFSPNVILETPNEAKNRLILSGHMEVAFNNIEVGLFPIMSLGLRDGSNKAVRVIGTATSTSNFAPDWIKISRRGKY